MKRRIENKPIVRLARPELKVKPKVKAPEPKPQISFDLWWGMAMERWGLKPELKNIIKSFFVASAITDSNDYDKGLVKFGLELNL